MSIERYLRLIAGIFVLLSIALGYWVSPIWFLFTAFVGLNLFQSAFTDWCPMMSFLRVAQAHGLPAPPFGKATGATSRHSRASNQT